MVRAGVYLELVRYVGDDKTVVGLLDAMDGGARISIPVEVLLELMREAQLLIAA